MRIHPKCHEEVEDNFEICWSCNYSSPSDKTLGMVPAEESNDSGWSIDCLHCQVKMAYSEEYELHEGINTGIFGDLLELFQNCKAFDLYVYPKCGKAEPSTPLDREREFKIEQTGNGESVYKSRH